jgi:hypothetical protein
VGEKIDRRQGETNHPAQPKAARAVAVLHGDRAQNTPQANPTSVGSVFNLSVKKPPAQ